MHKNFYIEEKMLWHSWSYHLTHEPLNAKARKATQPWVDNNNNDDYNLTLTYYLQYLLSIMQKIFFILNLRIKTSFDFLFFRILYTIFITHKISNHNASSKNHTWNGTTIVSVTLYYYYIIIKLFEPIIRKYA